MDIRSSVARTELLTIRLSKAEHARFRKVARRYSLPVVAMIRMLVAIEDRRRNRR
jgi:hypothetical protein